jgi:primosomal protein N' (replication factor Y)
MRYYFVRVAEVTYQRDEPLTYASEDALVAGTLVKVPYGKKQVLGFVQSETSRPSFPTKDITTILTDGILPSCTLALFEWAQAYYPGAGGALAQAFIPNGITVRSRVGDSGMTVAKQPLPTLTEEQKAVIDQIKDTPKQAFLLHGETGSGKTRVYLEEAASCLESGRSVLLLAPEISLVPQLETAATTYLEAKVVVLHSGLTKATRTRNWLTVLRADQPIVIIGTRSALFAPCKNIGLIVVDEMHEPAYKQESTPRYHGLRIAAQAARLHDAKILYGSATPPVVEYYIASQTGTPILRMQKTAKPTEEVRRSVVDLRDTSLFSRHRSLSDPLLAAIGRRLVDGEQSLLFLNRRGSFRQILCQTCGWQAACPNCDIPLTYHGDEHRMRCHTCAYRSDPPINCPVCGSDDITYRSLGTKALVDSLQTLFPEALIQRFDTDNLAAEQLHKHFEAIHAGKVDILVGTQMLGKGLDLPKLSLVGIVNADTSLGMPDFSSAERSYQLLHQAIGRVGRGHLSGEVIVQTFNPNDPLLQAATTQDWQALYDLELAERQSFRFPPFTFLLKISVSRKSSASAEAFTTKLHRQIIDTGLKIRVNDPTPSFYEKSHGYYNWQIVIRAQQRDQLVQLVRMLPKGDWSYDLDPINLL